MRWLVRLVLGGIALFITSLVLNALPKDISYMEFHVHTGDEMLRAALAIFCLSLVNSLIRPVVKILSLPLTFATMGLSSLLINAALFWAVGYFTGGYKVEGIVGLLIGPIIMGIASGLLNLFVRD